MLAACQPSKEGFQSITGLDDKHLSEELFFQLICPLLVCLGVHSQVTNVSTLEHHLHAHTLSNTTKAFTDCNV